MLWDAGNKMRCRSVVVSIVFLEETLCAALPTTWVLSFLLCRLSCNNRFGNLHGDLSLPNSPLEVSGLCGESSM